MSQWAFQEGTKWKVSRDSDVIKSNILKGDFSFTIGNYDIVINPDMKTGTQTNRSTEFKRRIRLIGEESTSVTGNWEFQEGKKWKVSRDSDVIKSNILKGDFSFTIGNYDIVINPDIKTGTQTNRSTKFKRRIRLNTDGGGGGAAETEPELMNRHMQLRFDCVKRMVTSNPSLEVVVPSDCRWKFYPNWTCPECTTETSMKNNTCSLCDEPKPKSLKLRPINYDKDTNDFILQNVNEGKSNFELILGKVKCEVNIDLATMTGKQKILKTGSYEDVECEITQECNLGKYRAKGQWQTKYGSLTHYNMFMRNLQKNVVELVALDPSRVRYGMLMKVDNPNVVQLWGANLSNYDEIASRGKEISGGGQARAIGRHTQSSFGIITTISKGIPTEEEGHFTMERICRRPGKSISVTKKHKTTKKHTIKPTVKEDWSCLLCDTKNPITFDKCMACNEVKPLKLDNWFCSICGSINPKSQKKCHICTCENQFRPYSKIKTVRTIDTFISNLLRMNRKYLEKANRELRNGRKTTHWVWFIFPQPLNVFDMINLQKSTPSKETVNFSFNNYEEALAFIENGELMNNYIESLRILISSMTTKSITQQSILGSGDSKKVSSSINHILSTLSSKQAFGGFLNPQQKELFDLIQNEYYKIPKALIGNIIKKKTKKKSKFRKVNSLKKRKSKKKSKFRKVNSLKKRKSIK